MNNREDHLAEKHCVNESSFDSARFAWKDGRSKAASEIAIHYKYLTKEVLYEHESG